MFGIGLPEFILILVVGLVVFGPSKLPELARTVGKGVREFRKASSALTQALNAQPETVSKQAPAPTTAQSQQPATTVTTAANTTPDTKADTTNAATTDNVAQTAQVTKQEATVETIIAKAEPVAPAYKAPTQESVREKIAEQAAAQKK